MNKRARIKPLIILLLVAIGLFAYALGVWRSWVDLPKIDIHFGHLHIYARMRYYFSISPASTPMEFFPNDPRIVPIQVNIRSYAIWITWEERNAQGNYPLNYYRRIKFCEGEKECNLILPPNEQQKQPYPHPSHLPILANTEVAYPYSANTPLVSLSSSSERQITATSLSADMTAVPASKEVLAIANKNFGHFFQQLPFVKTAKDEPYREYYGCINSQNAGSIINYTVTTQTAESIMIALTEYFVKQEIKHTDWEEFDISGFLGYSWTISASYNPPNDSDALVIIHGDLLEYKLRATPESPEVTPTEDATIPESHVYLYLNHFKTSDQITGYKQTDLLRTCENGWWLAINP